jgi:hypothetical protein
MGSIMPLLQVCFFILILINMQGSIYIKSPSPKELLLILLIILISLLIIFCHDNF